MKQSKKRFKEDKEFRSFKKDSKISKKLNKNDLLFLCSTEFLVLNEFNNNLIY